ncbi:MAG TPA: DUF86 domain-containing protein [Candidatus Binatia bacterium]|nr:DUF86 domain-containing protein [Candidatus Binatia bacterium]
MPKHDDVVRLRHMLEHAREAIVLMEGKNHADLESSRLHLLAIVRLVEIIGEAASRVSQATQRKYPQIPWPQIIGMRNRLVHGYDVVDIGIVWQTVNEELSPLIAELERILSTEDT